MIEIISTNNITGEKLIVDLTDTCRREIVDSRCADMAIEGSPIGFYSLGLKLTISLRTDGSWGLLKYRFHSSKNHYLHIDLQMAPKRYGWLKPSDRREIEVGTYNTRKDVEGRQIYEYWDRDEILPLPTAAQTTTVADWFFGRNRICNLCPGSSLQQWAFANVGGRDKLEEKYNGGKKIFLT
jgi:hypothetical protein